MLGRVVRCPADVSPFLAMPADTTEQDRADAATLVGPGDVVPRAGATSPPPPDGGTVHSVPGVQLADDGVTAPAPADPAPPERVLGRLTRREDGHRAAVEGRPVPLTVRGVGHRLDAA